MRLTIPALLLCSCVCTARAAAQEGAPNIVLVLADDLGYGDPRCYQPGSKIPTPNIDRLAAEGLRFTDAHSPSAVCTPTRYGLLTGRYAWRTELQSSVLWPWDEPLIEEERTTLPELLRSAGYATACIGKWHLGWEWPRREGAPQLPELVAGRYAKAERVRFGAWIDFDGVIAGGPTAHGFDAYYGDDVPNFPPYTFLQDDRVLVAPSEEKPPGTFGHEGPAAPGWDLTRVMPALTERAVAWIDGREEGQPFFLYLPLTAPHTPIAPLERFHGKSGAGRYGDYVHQVDWTLGEVLRALERNELTQDTIVIFTSDNGSPMRNGAGMSGPTGSVTAEFGHDSSGPLRGMKSDIWEGGHRVPLVVRWPAVVEANSASEALFCLTDLYRTLASAAGCAVPEHAGEDSEDLLDVWRGERREGREVIVHHSGNGTFAIREGRWKLVLDNLGSGGFTRPSRVQPGDGEPRGQLYDLARDLGEEHNLYAEEPQRVAELRRLLEELRAKR